MTIAAPPIRRRALLLAALPLPMLALATAPEVPPEVLAHLPTARLLGSGRLRHFGLHIHDARLWADASFDPGGFSDVPLALELEYARTLEGALIAERSLDEMRRLEEMAASDAAAWLSAMKRMFPDVRAGVRLTGVQQPGIGVAFFLNGRPLGEVRDPEFARRFFAIWLSPRTSAPQLRRDLLGADHAARR